MGNDVSKESRENTLQSPEKICDHLRVTYVPTYLLALVATMLLLAFIVWGVLGTVSDKERCGTSGSHALTASSPQARHVGYHCLGT
jgi:hypothetical protein